jgi:hypothetical protein
VAGADNLQKPSLHFLSFSVILKHLLVNMKAYQQQIIREMREGRLSGSELEEKESVLLQELRCAADEKEIRELCSAIVRHSNLDGKNDRCRNRGEKLVFGRINDVKVKNGRLGYSNA